MPQPLRGRSTLPAKTLSKRYERTSATSRGYDHVWRKVSAEHRRRQPFCAWCEQIGKLEFAKEVDHKFPIVDGGSMFASDNRWGLCKMHHSVKGEMERFARQTGEIEKLPLWCDDPTARPARFR
jgi:5-methylcytosine-specific restriction endonuclease McrA